MKYVAPHMQTRKSQVNEHEDSPYISTRLISYDAVDFMNCLLHPVSYLYLHIHGSILIDVKSLPLLIDMNMNSL